MARRFKHLTFTDRLKIEAYVKDRKRVGEIAILIGVSHSTISRELRRGNHKQMTTHLAIVNRYAAEVAEKKYRNHLKAKGADLKIGNDHQLAEYIEARIADDKYSPAAVLGEIKVKGLQFSTTICTSTLYSYIAKEIFSRITNKDLPLRGKRKRVYRKVLPARAPKGDSIEKRPPDVGSRSTFGHWEIDTMHSGKHAKESLLVLTERMTRKEIIRYMPDRTAGSVVTAMDRLELEYESLYPLVFKTITCDNGSEFSDFYGIQRGKEGRIKRTSLYYCHPYSAYERGSNENQNKLIRRHFPKGTSFAKVTADDIERVENWLNRYPRCIFGYQSADTMFNEQIAAIQLT
jgi:IS30 family transposase